MYEERTIGFQQGIFVLSDSFLRFAEVPEEESDPFGPGEEDLPDSDDSEARLVRFCEIFMGNNLEKFLYIITG